MKFTKILKISLIFMLLIISGLFLNTTAQELDPGDGGGGGGGGGTTPSTTRILEVSGRVLNEYSYLIDASINIQIPEFSVNTIVHPDSNGNYFYQLNDVSLPFTVTTSFSRDGYNDMTFSDTIDSSTPYYITGEYEYTYRIEHDFEGVRDTNNPGTLVEGYATDINGNPLQGAIVELWDTTSYTAGDTDTTTSTGFYSLYATSLSGDILLNAYPDSNSPVKQIYLDPIIQTENYYRKNFTLSYDGYVHFSGIIEGYTETGDINDVEYVYSAQIEFIAMSTGEIVHTAYSNDLNGFSYFALPDSNGYTLRVSADGYITQDFLFTSANGGDYYHFDIYGTHRLILEFDLASSSDESWFNNLFSKIKEKAWDFLVDFVEENINGTHNFHLEKEFGIKGMSMSASLDINVTWDINDPYKLGLRIIDLPLGEDRPGSYVAVSLPPPLTGLDGALRFGMDMTFYDKDEDITTFNPGMTVHSVSIGAAIQAGESITLADLLDKTEDAGSEEGNERLGDLIGTVGASLSAEVFGEVGAMIKINEGVDFTHGQDYNNGGEGWELESISFFPYFHFHASVEASLSFELEVYLNDYYGFSVVDVSVAVAAGLSIDYYPWQMSYFFDEHRFQLYVSKIIYTLPYVHVSYEWSAVDGMFSGDGDLLNIGGDGEMVNSDWVFSRSFDNPLYASPTNDPPATPTLNGPTSTESGTLNTFTATSTDPNGDSLQYEFEYGDGIDWISGFTSSGTSVSGEHTYTADGTYTVRVRAYDGESYSDWTSMSVTVTDPSPTGVYLYIDNSANIGESVNAVPGVDDPGSQLVTYTINWGDGNSDSTGWVNFDSLTSFSHTYTTEGTYTVTLTVKNEFNGETSVTESITIIDPNTAPNAPTVSGSNLLNVGETGSWAAVTTDPDGDNIKYYYDFGDGTTWSSNWVSSGSSIYRNHAYSSIGTYTVKVRVSDGELTSAWVSITVEVKDLTPSQPNFNLPSSAEPGETITVVPTVSDPKSQQVRYFINWGDGASDSTGWVNYDDLVYFSHAYSSTGSYSVKVTVRNQHNQENSRTKSISIIIPNNPPNKPSTPSGPSSGSSGQYLSFSFYGTDPDGDNIRYKIYWGDGSTTTTGWVSSGQRVYRSHSFSTSYSKYFYVKVRVQDSHGAWSSYSNSKAVYITASGGIIISPFSADTYQSNSFQTTSSFDTSVNNINTVTRSNTNYLISSRR